MCARQGHLLKNLKPIFIGRPFLSSLMCLALVFLSGQPIETRAEEVSDQGFRIIKILPHFMDEKGRTSLSPSLFERDAYQAELRNNPERISGIRYDVQVKLPSRKMAALRLNLRTKDGDETRVVTLEAPVQRLKWGLGRNRWTSIVLDGETYRSMGDITAWRAELLENDRVMAQSQSFLW